MIAIIDYDTGNLRSVKNALHRLGAEFVVTSEHDVIRGAEKVLLPGVGEASAAMQKLRERGLDEVIPTLQVPVLGICIGMQLMCRHSEEGDAECMGIFDTDVVRFFSERSLTDSMQTSSGSMLNSSGSMQTSSGSFLNSSGPFQNSSGSFLNSPSPTELNDLKIPHMGWNGIEELKTGLFDGVEEGAFVYYVHSFHALMCDEAIAVSHHGVDFCGALCKGNFYGTQFHPEKSGATGARILHNFLKL